jgi:hypothetical protein
MATRCSPAVLALWPEDRQPKNGATPKNAAFLPPLTRVFRFARNFAAAPDGPPYNTPGLQNSGVYSRVGGSLARPTTAARSANDSRPNAASARPKRKATTHRHRAPARRRAEHRAPTSTSGRPSRAKRAHTPDRQERRRASRATREPVGRPRRQPRSAADKQSELAGCHGRARATPPRVCAACKLQSTVWGVEAPPHTVTRRPPPTTRTPPPLVPSARSSPPRLLRGARPAAGAPAPNAKAASGGRHAGAAPRRGPARAPCYGGLGCAVASVPNSDGCFRGRGHRGRVLITGCRPAAVGHACSETTPTTTQDSRPG